MIPRYSIQYDQCTDRWRVEVDYGDGFPFTIYECDEENTAKDFAFLARALRETRHEQHG